MATPTLTEIREAAQRLADARRVSILNASILEAALATAVTPIYQRHRPDIDEAAAREAAARSELDKLIEAAPHLFVRPRAITQDGVKCGYRKQEDSLDWDDEAKVITRIRAIPELGNLIHVLVRTEESLNVNAVAELDETMQRCIGVRTVPGIDLPFVSYTETDVEKLVKALLADAAKRQGEDEGKATRKSKPKAAKAREAA